MTKNEIRSLTLPEFGRKQKPQMDHSDIQPFFLYTASRTDEIDPFDDNSERIKSVTVGEIIDSWNKNVPEYAGDKDNLFRALRTKMIEPFVDALQSMDYPADEINELRKSLEHVRKGK